MSHCRPRITGTSLLCGLVLGLGAVVLVCGAMYHTDAAKLDASMAGTPEEALAAYVRLDGGTFAGPCEQTRSPDDIGSVCYRLVAKRDDLSAYLLGRTFSEFDTWVFLKLEPDGWMVLARAPLDFGDLTMTIPWPR